MRFSTKRQRQISETKSNTKKVPYAPQVGAIGRSEGDIPQPKKVRYAPQVGATGRLEGDIPQHSLTSPSSGSNEQRATAQVSSPDAQAASNFDTQARPMSKLQAPSEPTHKWADSRLYSIPSRTDTCSDDEC